MEQRGARAPSASSSSWAPRWWRCSLPHTRYALAAYYIIAPAEASANLARYDGVKYGYCAPTATDMWATMERTRDAGLRRRGEAAHHARHLRALGRLLRRLLPEGAEGAHADRQDFERAFERFDVLVAPTAPTVAFRLGEKVDDPLRCT